MHKGEEPPGEKPPLIRVADVARLLGFGWYFASAIIGGLVGGYFLDRWLDTRPLFILLGLLLGTAAGFYGMYRMLWPIYKGTQDR